MNCNGGDDMAEVIIGGKKFSKVWDIQVEHDYKEGITLKLYFENDLYHEECLRVRVPNYLRIEVDGDVGVVTSDSRVEVYGNVHFGRGKYLVKCDANVKNFITSSRGIKSSNLNCKALKITTLADEYKADGKKNVRATVLHVKGKVNLDIDEGDDDFDKFRIDTVIRGNVTDLVTTQELYVKGEALFIQSDRVALLKRKPLNIKIDDSIKVSAH